MNFSRAPAAPTISCPLAPALAVLGESTIIARESYAVANDQQDYDVGQGLEARATCSC